MTIVVGRCAEEIRNSNSMLIPSKFRSNANSHKAVPVASSLCVGCGSAIHDPFILHVQPDLEWHGRCLKCCTCHRPLGNDNTCFVRDGKAFCREDYLNTFCYRCAGCQQIVGQSDLVFRIRSRAFHLECFRCAVCEKPLKPGAEIALQDDQICCVVHCTPRWMSKRPTGQKSVGEEQRSYNDVTLSPIPSADYSLQGTKMNSMREDYNKTFDPLLFMQPDAKRGLSNADAIGVACGLKTSDSELHESFGTSPGPKSCNSSMGAVLRDMDSPFSPASELSLEDDSLVGLNNSHNQTLSEPNTLGPNSSVSSGLQAHSFNVSGASSTAHKGSGSSSSGTSGTGLCGDEIVHTINFTRNSPIGNGSRTSKTGGSSKRSKDQKTTRVRTVLNEKQLHTLRTCYAANPRPDALMKEQLVEMTSLSPRVIRVWFQNKRCKDKKRQILLKQMEQHQQNGNRPNTSLHGIPLIAGSPIRNESCLVCPNSSVDIHQLPTAYWKSTNPSEPPLHPGSSTFRNSPFRMKHPFPSVQSQSSDMMSSNLEPLYSTNVTSNSMLHSFSIVSPDNQTLSNTVAMPTDHFQFIDSQTFASEVVDGQNVMPVQMNPLEEPGPVNSAMPAFQQLVTTFDTTDALKINFPFNNTPAAPMVGFPNRISPDPSLYFRRHLAELGQTTFQDELNNVNVELVSSQLPAGNNPSPQNLLMFAHRNSNGPLPLIDHFKQSKNMATASRTQLST